MFEIVMEHPKNPINEQTLVNQNGEYFRANVTFMCKFPGETDLTVDRIMPIKAEH